MLLGPQTTLDCSITAEKMAHGNELHLDTCSQYGPFFNLPNIQGKTWTTRWLLSPVGTSRRMLSVIFILTEAG